MRWFVLPLALIIAAGCTVRKPLQHESVNRTYLKSEKIRLMKAMEGSLVQQKIKIAQSDLNAGLIVSDSFDVDPEYCDCGLNLFGEDYPGERRGVMRITFAGSADVKITFDFKTRLIITTNQKQILCTSFGKLEQLLLEGVDKQLGSGI